jgi:hypothetical protein
MPVPRSRNDTNDPSLVAVKPDHNRKLDVWHPQAAGIWPSAEWILGSSRRVSSNVPSRTGYFFAPIRLDGVSSGATTSMSYS